LSSGNSGAASASTWYHVCGTKVGTNWSIYVDGVLKNSASVGNGTTPFARNPVYICRVNNPLSNYTPATCDDIRIYNRALSATEVSLLSKERGIGFKTSSRTSSHFAKRYSYKPPKDKTYAAITRSQSEHDSLREGLVGAWCPSVTGATGFRLIDKSGYNNHGTLTNMTSEDWVVSGGSLSLDFDGTDDNCSFTSLQLTTKKTISFWYYRRGIPSASHLVLAGATGDYYCLFLYDDVYISQGLGNFTLLGSNQVIRNKWTHLAIVGDGTTATLYTNGKSVASGNDKTPSLSRIGTYSNSASNFYDGQLDDIRIYNRALTPAEIRLLASKRGIGLAPRPRHYTYYQFPSASRRRKLITGMP
jgi:hypothetical protein